MASTAAEALGLIAGSGGLPLAMARSVRSRGRGVAVVAFHGQTDPRLEEEADPISWLHPGEVEAVVEALRASGVRKAVMAGKIGKAALLDAADGLRLDASARQLLEGLSDRRDDTILRAIADYLQSRGIELLPQAELVPDLLPGPGPLGAVRPSAAQEADVAFAWSIARALAGLDVGQTVVVKDRAVLAVEALEGTDAAIRRAGELAAGSCVIKVAKPRQDPRFDVPTLGLGSADALVDAGASLLAFEAGRTLVLDRGALAARADAAGIAVLGLDPALGPGAP